MKEDIRWQEAHSVSDFVQATIAENFGPDPLLRLLTHVVHRPWQAGVAVWVTNAIVFFGIGFFVAKFYPKMNVIPIFDPGELRVEIFIWLIFAPIMWLAYVWMPRGVLQTVLLLQKNGVIPRADNCSPGKLGGGEPKSSQADLLFAIVRSFKTSRWPIVVGLALTVVSNGAVLVSSGLKGSTSTGHLIYWFSNWGTLAELFVINSVSAYLALRLKEGKWPAVLAIAVALLANAVLPATSVEMASIFTSRISFLFVNPGTRSVTLLMNGISTYVVAITVLTAALAAKEIHVFFASEYVPISVHPMHPDKCGGFGPLGWMAMRWGWLAVLGFIWIIVLTLGPFLRGDSPRLWLLMLPLYLAYAVVVFGCLLLPILAAHWAMQRFKNAKLKELAEALASVLYSVENIRDWPVTELQLSVAKTTKLRRLYRTVQETMPTWPIAAPEFRKFSITVILPPIFSLLSVALDTLPKLLSH